MFQAIDGVPVDGVISIRAAATGSIEDAMELLSMTVTLDDMEVPGTLETVVYETRLDLGVEAHELFVVWRPAEPLVGSSSYDVHVASEEPVQQWGFPVSTLASAAGALPVPGVEILAFDTSPFGSEPRVCCNNGDPAACGEDVCASPEIAEYARPEVNVSIGSDPMYSQVYARLRVGVDGTTEPHEMLGLAHGTSGWYAQPLIREMGDSYCVGVDVVSLIDGVISDAAMQCVDADGFVVEPEANPSFAAFLEQCVGEPYWEDTGEPYEPGDGTTDGPADSGTSTDDEGGSVEGDGSSDDVGGDGDDDDATGNGDGSDGSDASEDASDDGCGCGTTGREPRFPGLVVLALGTKLRRRRRR